MRRQPWRPAGRPARAPGLPPDSARVLRQNRGMTRAPFPLRIPLRDAFAVVFAAVIATAAVPSMAAAPVKAADAATEGRRGHGTGDAWLDARLADIDAYAIRHPDAFAAELERYAGVPRAYVHGLLAQPDWGGGDAWFACFLARATEATCRSVVRARTHAGVEAEWETVAAGFGARPGAEAYAAVRLSLADSFRRWAVPAHPDAALSRALRKRAEAGP